MTTNNNTANVVACPHPFKAQHIQIQVQEGRTIASLLDEMQPNKLLFQNAHVYVNDNYIPSAAWEDTIVKVNDDIIIRIVATGGSSSGKNPLKTILSIVVIAVAAWVAGPSGLGWGSKLAGLTGLSTELATGLVTATLSIAGQLAINALIPTSTQFSLSSNTAEENVYSISSGSNQAKQYSPIRVIFGKHKIVPDYGALPYTEIVGNEQYYNMLFVWGYGPLSITDIKIGDTDINDYEDVEVQTIQGYSGQSSSLSLFPKLVYEENVQVEVAKSDGWIQRTTDANTDKISLDFVFERLVTYDLSSGAKSSASAFYAIEYKHSSSSTWLKWDGSYSWVTDYVDLYNNCNRFLYHKLPLSDLRKLSWSITYNSRLKMYRLQYFRYGGSDWNLGGTWVGEGLVEYLRNSAPDPNNFWPNSAYTFRGKTETTKFFNRSKSVTRGQYDVRVKRLIQDYNSDSYVYSAGIWYVLRSITNESPVKMDNVAMTAVRIKATNQLNGVISSLSGVCTSILPSYNSSTDTWTTQTTTQNAADHLLAILQGPANKRPVADSRIDWDSFKAFHNYFKTQGFACNYVLESRVSVWDLMRDILTTGRATPDLIDGKWGVIIDSEKTDIIQHFTPRNSWGFQATKNFTDTPHAWNVNFLNEEEEYKQDVRIVYDDGYDSSNASLFEDLDVRGVTNPSLVWRQGRYYIAVARLRPETYSFYADIEHIVCTRGDLIRCTSPVTLWGIKSARIKSIVTLGSNITHLVLDDFVTMEVGKSYFIRIRLNSGESVLKEVVTNPGDTYTLEFLTVEPISTGINLQDLCMFGEEELESVELIVKSIELSSDLSAKLVCLDAASEIHSLSDSSNIPAFNSQITTSKSVTTPPTPIIISVISDESVMTLNSSGVYIPRILVNFKVNSSKKVYVYGYNIQIQPVDGEWRQLPDLSKDTTTVSITDDVTEGESYNIRIRSFTEIGEVSPWATISNHEYVGRTTLPPDIENLVVTNDKLQWTYPNPPLDFAGFRVKHITGNNRSWLQATTAGTGYASSPFDISSFGKGTRTFLVKAEDTAGNQSANAAILVQDLGDVDVANAIYEYDYHPNWAGTITNGDIISEEIIGQSSINFWTGIDSNEVWTGVYSNAIWDTFYDVLTYQDTFVSPYQDETLLFNLDVTAKDGWFFDLRQKLNNKLWTGENTNNIWTALDDSSFWYATSSDWFAWPGSLTIKQQEYDLRIKTVSGSNTPVISSLTAIIDLSDKSEILNDIVIEPTGTRLPITLTYQGIKSVVMTLQDDGGDAVILKRVDFSVAGPLIYAYDASGTATSALIDVTVLGY